MEQRIYSAAAPLHDAAAIAEFLASIPNGEVLGKLLSDRSIVSTRAYDDDLETARFVVSDGKVAKCFTVTRVTIDQAEMIAAQCEVDHAWNTDEFRDAVERALGSDFWVVD